MTRPEINIEKELFKIFQSEKDSFELMKKILAFAQRVDHEACGQCGAFQYDLLRRLSNKINNAGHEEERSNVIHLLNERMHHIDERWGDFLP